MKKTENVTAEELLKNYFTTDETLKKLHIKADTLKSYINTGILEVDYRRDGKKYFLKSQIRKRIKYLRGKEYVHADDPLAGLQFNFDPPADPVERNNEAVMKRAEGYFRRCHERDKPPTVAGLALALGFKRKQDMLELRTDVEIGDALNHCITWIEQEVAEVMQNSTKNCAAYMFLLKQPEFGYQDKPDLSALPERTAQFNIVVKVEKEDKEEKPVTVELPPADDF